MALKDRSDEELMFLCRDGDTAALTELFRRYKDRIYSFAYRLLGNASRAEDVLQETFLRIHRSADSWQPSAKFSSWAFKITRNLCVDEKRKYWNRKVMNETEMAPSDDGGKSDALAAMPEAGESPREAAEYALTADAVRQAIESLSPEQQEVMMLSKYEGLSYPEIAEVLDISQESVKQRAYRAHLRLRSALQPLLEDHAVR